MFDAMACLRYSARSMRWMRILQAAGAAKDAGCPVRLATEAALGMLQVAS